MECGKTFLYLRRKVGSQYHFAYVPSLCKSWSCDRCRKIKAKILERHIKSSFDFSDTFLLTLTYYHSGDPLVTWKNVGDHWNKMRSYIQYLYGHFTYVRIIEPHKHGGFPHLHILIQGNIIDSRILHNITRWGYGWNAHYMRVSDNQAACYISKYLSKPWPDLDSDLYRIISKTRIVSQSSDLPPIFQHDSDWRLVRREETTKVTLEVLNALIDILRSNNAKEISTKPFLDGFLIVSDIELTDDLISGSHEYCWFRADSSLSYSYFPNGEQLSIL